MDQELQEQIVSLKKQNAISVYELLKTQKRLSKMEQKIEMLEKTIQILIEDKNAVLNEQSRLTIEKLNKLKKFLD